MSPPSLYLLVRLQLKTNSVVLSCTSTCLGLGVWEYRLGVSNPEYKVHVSASIISICRMRPLILSWVLVQRAASCSMEPSPPVYVDRDGLCIAVSTFETAIARMPCLGVNDYAMSAMFN